MSVLGLMHRWPKRVWISFDLLYFDLCGFFCHCWVGCILDIYVIKCVLCVLFADICRL